MKYRIELDAKQIDLVLNVLGCVQTSDDESGLFESAREIGDIANSIEQQMLSQEGAKSRSFDDTARMGRRVRR